MSTIAVNAITDASGGNTASINGATPTTDNTMGRNRIINGDMRIDARNAGASVALTDGLYFVDRWKASISQTSKLTGQQSSTVPAGFVKSLSATVGTAFTPGAGDYAGLVQPIEGNNVSDLNFGSAGASTVTLSFWVRSSVTGTYSVTLHNADPANRSYVTTYAINAADTWEQKSVTIAGDTSGTWATDNTASITAYFALGMGSTYGGATANTWNASLKLAATGQTQWVSTAGATFYLTGVQLEAGSVATSFERRSYGQELALCQRYYYRIKGSDTALNTGIVGVGFSQSTTAGRSLINFPVTMRSFPSALEQSGTASHFRIIAGSAGSITCSAVPVFSSASTLCGDISWTVASAAIANQGVYFASNNASSYLAWSAEL